MPSTGGLFSGSPRLDVITADILARSFAIHPLDWTEAVRSAALKLYVLRCGDDDSEQSRTETADSRKAIDGRCSRRSWLLR